MEPGPKKQLLAGFPRRPARRHAAVLVSALCGGGKRRLPLARDRDGSLLDTDKGMWHNAVPPGSGHALQHGRASDEWLDWAKPASTSFRGTASTRRPHVVSVTRGGPDPKKALRVHRDIWGDRIRGPGQGDRRLAQAEKARNLFGLAKRHFANPSLTAPKFAARGRPRPSVPDDRHGHRAGVAPQPDDESLTADIDAAIGEIRRDFMKPDIECVMESVAPDGSIIDHFDGRTLNPGHAIECAWFILWEAKRRGNDPEFIRMGCQILDWMWGGDGTTNSAACFIFVMFTTNRCRSTGTT
ncbi:MAG: hypothetical protein Ct9H300mP7_5820 [Verrucomicrobiota bacterium]|nr:MAG: hypothetical protein Ct9H300mP7_5820 [Verrucomicrobiota bacterium]